MALLELRKLSKSFGSVRALDGFDLDVEKGEVVGIVGPNGSGKTTLLNVISGYYRPTSGAVTYKGKSIGGLRPDTITALGVVRTFQQNVVYWDTNALENIVRTSYLSTRPNLWASFFNTRSYVKEEEMIRARAMEIVTTCGLSDYCYTPAASLPHGKQRSLGIAMSLAANPELLLLDEPLAGMDASEREFVAQNIRKIIARGMTVMMVEHNIASVIELCPRIVVLDFGQKLADGKPEDVLSRPDVVEAYLGVDE